MTAASKDPDTVGRLMTRLLRTGLVFLFLTSPLCAQPAGSVRLLLPVPSDAVVQDIGRVFARQVQQRCSAQVVTAGEAPLVVELSIESGLGAEGFRIVDRTGNGVRIIGNDARGLLYGVGKFLRTSRYDQEGFAPGTLARHIRS